MLYTEELDVTLNECMDLFNSEHPDLSIKIINDTGKQFFITAPHKDIDGSDYSDPFFIVDKKTRKIEHFLPSSDMKTYQKYAQSKLVFDIEKGSLY